MGDGSRSCLILAVSQADHDVFLTLKNRLRFVQFDLSTVLMCILLSLLVESDS